MNFPVNMYKIRELTDKVTNVVMNYTEVEAKVREATNDDPWGPTGPIMHEIAQYTYTYENFPEVMGMLWKRMLQDNKNNWRRTYKSLLLLSHLIRNGSERVVTSAREHVYDLRRLERYTFVDEMGKDQGVNVRQKVKDLLDFIQDDDRLREERKKAKKNRDKYIGLSGQEASYRYGRNSRYDDGFGSRNTANTSSTKPEFRDMDDWREPSTVEKIESKIRETLNFGRRPDTDTPDFSNDDEDFKYEDSDDPGSGRTRDFYDDDDGSPYRSTSSSPNKPQKPVKKIDLGAAATYSGGQQANLQTTTAGESWPGTETLSSEPIFETAKPKQTSNIDLLGDLDSPAAPTPVAHPTQANGDFGAFQAPPGVSPAFKESNNFADFAQFSEAPSSSSDITTLSIQPQVVSSSFDVLSPPKIGMVSTAQPAGSPNMVPPQGAAMPLQPAVQPTSSFPLGTTAFQAPQAHIMPQQRMMSPSGVPINPAMMSQPAAPMSQLPMMSQPAMQSPMFSQPGMVASQAGLPMQQQTGMMVPQQTMLSSQQGQQQKWSAQQQSTWTNIGKVDISLESLTNPASKYQKQTAPSMNQLRSPPGGFGPGFPGSQASQGAGNVQQQQSFASFTS